MYSILEGVTILDLTKVLSGPLATRSLADLGATVIKIESNSHLDPARTFPPLDNDWSGYFEILNRNKKSITLDLSRSSDRNKLYQITKKADVIVENMTPSVKKKLAVDFDHIKHYNPEIIYASLSGVDQKTDRKYFDLIAQAESGLMGTTGIDSPTKIGPAVVDAFSGMTLAFAISSALLYKQKTGKGCQISVSMLASAMNLLEHNIIQSSITRQNPPFPGNHDTAIAPFGVFKTYDGFIVLAIGSESLWKVFSTSFSLTQDMFSTNEKRLTNLYALIFEIEKAFSSYTTNNLLDVLHELSVPASSIYSMIDVINNPVMYNIGALQKITLNNQELITTGRSITYSTHFNDTYKPAPSVGQDNDDYGIQD